MPLAFQGSDASSGGKKAGADVANLNAPRYTFSINNQRDLQYYDDAKGTWNTQSLIRTNLTADPTYNLFNQTVGRVDLWEAQYAANPNLGYTKDGVNGAGWKVAPDTCFTVTVANSSATIGAYAVTFKKTVRAHIAYHRHRRSANPA